MGKLESFIHETESFCTLKDAQKRYKFYKDAFRFFDKVLDFEYTNPQTNESTMRFTTQKGILPKNEWTVALFKPFEDKEEYEIHVSNIEFYPNEER